MAIKPKTKVVQLRLQKATIEHIRRVAKAADVTPTQVYNVIMAMAVVQRESAAASSKQEG